VRRVSVLISVDGEAIAVLARELRLTEVQVLSIIRNGDIVHVPEDQFLDRVRQTVGYKARVKKISERDAARAAAIAEAEERRRQCAEAKERRAREAEERRRQCAEAKERADRDKAERRALIEHAKKRDREIAMISRKFSEQFRSFQKQ